MHTIIEHTADIGLIVKSDSFKHALEELTLAMMDLILDIRTVELKEKRNVRVQNENVEDLVIDFLSELIYLFDAEHFVPGKVNVTTGSNYVDAELEGERYNRDKHSSKLEIKAVTYHLLNIDKTKTEISVLFDI